jgi:hypothetical protein
VFLGLSAAGVLVTFAQQPANQLNDEYLGRWIGPVLSSLASVVATIFAYLTARDSKRFDSSRQIMEFRMAAAEAEAVACRTDRDAMKAELAKIRLDQEQKFREMWEQMQNGDDMERRKKQEKGAPKRRVTDPKTKTHASLPDNQNPVTPESQQ